MVKGNNATFNYSTDRARIADLEAELAALREFVVADDAYEWALEAALTLEDFDRCTELLKQKEAARRRLADEFGLPLPEVER